MSESTALHPIGVLKEAIKAWAKNFVPVTLIYGMVIVFTKSIDQLKPFIEQTQVGWKAWGMPVVFFVNAAAVVVLNSFLMLCILRYIEEMSGKTVKPFDVIRDSTKRLTPYLKAFVLWLGFMFSVVGVAYVFFWGGGTLRSMGPAAISNGIKTGVLLGTSTISVVLVILAAWYGFFFSLAPLIAVYEGKGPWASILESRRLIRGNALRYLAGFIIVLASYIIVGIGVLLLLARFTYNKMILNTIDPAIASIFMPLWFTVWYIAYKRLREIKRT